MKRKPKVFEAGQAVEVKRTSGSRSWEPATYRSKIENMRGWHRVDLAPESEPRFISMADGYETEPTDATAVEVRHCIVPTQRIRAARAY